MDTAKIILSVILFAAECYLAYQIFRIARVVRRARANMARAKSSNDHPASVRLFVDAQTKIVKMDMMMGAMFVVGFTVIAFLLATMTR